MRQTNSAQACSECKPDQACTLSRGGWWCRAARARLHHDRHGVHGAWCACCRPMLACVCLESHHCVNHTMLADCAGKLSPDQARYCMHRGCHGGSSLLLQNRKPLNLFARQETACPLLFGFFSHECLQRRYLLCSVQASSAGCPLLSREPLLAKYHAIYTWRFRACIPLRSATQGGQTMWWGAGDLWHALQSFRKSGALSWYKK